MIICGIDPGFSGAVVFYCPKRNLLEIHDMPTMKDPKGRTIVNMPALYDLLNPCGEDVRAVVEFVASRPGQAAGATFRFGQGYGAIQMALAAHQVPVQYVTPAKWKKYFGLSKNKGSSRGLAIQRFPQVSDKFSRVKDDGRAEAALIALYGKENFF